VFRIWTSLVKVGCLGPDPIPDLSFRNLLHLLSASGLESARKLVGAAFFPSQSRSRNTEFNFIGLKPWFGVENLCVLRFIYWRLPYEDDRERRRRGISTWSKSGFWYLKKYSTEYFLSFLFIYRTDIVPKVTIFFYKYTKHKIIAVVLDHEEYKIT
jgi:hypothetical protein